VRKEEGEEQCKVQSHGHGRKEEGEEQCRCQISDCRLQIVDWEESEGRMQNEEPNGDR
jgi:hypothetical protein